MAQSSFFLTVDGGPQIDPGTTFPFPIGDPIPPLNDLEHPVITSPNHLAPYLNDPLPVECLPNGLDPAITIKDPTEVLRKQIQNQDITNTIVIAITTSFPSPLTTSSPIQRIVNIPFVVANANATQMDAIFWIEKVTNPTFPDRHYLQLQYVQRVILDFVMNGGRWYPTATTLADGRVLVSSGSAAKNGNAVVNDTPQIWDGAQWHDTVTFIGLPLYPWMHLAPDARVFMSGSNATTYFLDTAGTGTWTPLPGPGGLRPNGERQYAPSVMYEPDKVIYIGGPPHGYAVAGVSPQIHRVWPSAGVVIA